VSEVAADPQMTMIIETCSPCVALPYRQATTVMCIHVVLINSYNNNDDPVSGIMRMALSESQIVR